MSLNVFKNMARTAEEMREQNNAITLLAIGTAPIWIPLIIFFAIKDWYQGLDHTPYATASIHTVEIPFKLQDNSFYDRFENAKPPNVSTISSDPKWEKKVNGFYEISYMDINRDGNITPLETEYFEDNRLIEKQDYEIGKLLKEYPKFDGIINNMHYLTAAEVIKFSKDQPKKFKYMVEENAETPENLRRLLIHGVTQLEKRTSLDGSHDSGDRLLLNFNWGTEFLDLSKEMK